MLLEGFLLTQGEKLFAYCTKIKRPKFSLYECAVKEAEEEASIPPSLSKAAKFVSCQKTCYHTPHYVKPEVNYIFDLKLPEEFTPVVNDGEAQNFKRVKLDESLELFDDLSKWKPNSMAITLDFCIRKGLLT